MSARATVVIVSYNTRALLHECLISLAKYAAGYPIIVVDNASVDGSAAMVRSEFPAVQLMCNADNHGFGAANNRALAAVDTEFVMLLNSDARVEADAVALMAATLDRRPDVAIVGCRLTSPLGVTERSARRFPSVARSLRGALALGDTTPTGLTEVDYVDGAAILARTSALREVGGFDERFFFYGEDADLCRRLWMRGWRIVYDPETHVVHVGGGSTVRGSRADDRQRWEALARYAAIHFGPWEYRAFICARALELLRQAITGALRGVFLIDATARQLCHSALRNLAWHSELVGRRASFVSRAAR